MGSPILVIFGITGDLSKRKLLPALYHIFSQQLLPSDVKIIGVSRHDLTIDDLLTSVELCVSEVDNVCDPVVMGRLKAALETIKLDPTSNEDFTQLKQRLETLADGSDREFLFYMSIPPAAYAPIVENLGKVGLNSDNCRLILEKPFGHDTQSAKELIAVVNTSFNEDKIYRTDHYLAKDTAQNLLTFRLYNPIFETIWNAEHIKSVHIRAVEQIGIEGRADFYEQTGALRDLIQSHLLQLLALSLMDLPSDLNSDQIHRSKHFFLEQLLPADPSTVTRGQYQSYRQEVNNSDSTTETYVQLHLKHDAERWQGVDIILETGKALAAKDTSITIEFKTNHEHPSNNLRFQIQPNEGISLQLVVKKPGLAGGTAHKSLNFDYENAFAANQHIDAYERVLMDAINADQSLFASSDEIMATWQVIQPLLDAWKDNGDGLKLYPTGADPDSVS